MSASLAQRQPTPSHRSELALVIALGLLAGVRVFVGAAALPLFTNVDEQAHFDLVHKLATGHWPGSDTPYFDAEASRLIVLYGSPEFLTPPHLQDVQRHIPYWMVGTSDGDPEVQRQVALWTTTPNHEAHSPPVYYLLAAAWYDLGSAAGLQGGFLLYWVRFLNVLLYPAVLVLSYFFVRRFYPGQRFLRLSVPVLLAAFPQDVFFSINNDAASPLFFTGALFLLLEWHDREHHCPWLGLAAGLAAALTFLVKLSNVAVLVLLALLLADKARRLAQAGLLRRRAGELLLSVAAAAGPVLGWLGSNAVLLGDPFGTAAKVASLGWTYKPLSKLGNHPFFTPFGFGYFWDGLIRTFWRGETVWHLQQIAPAGCDWFFVGCTVLLIPAAAIRWWLHRREPEPDGWLLVAVGTSALFLLALSLVFDFGFCWYPSRARPFLTSGRLIIGVLVPFLILLVRGLEFLSFRGLEGARLAVVAALVAASLASRLSLIAAALPSAYNWFHLG